MLATTKPPEPKRCCNCPREFVPKYTSMQVACSLRCAAAFARKERLAKERQEREQDRQRRHALKRLNEFKADAQDAFNAFIRARDADPPCVSCEATDPPWTRGGQWDAGHFLSRGAYPELAFNEDNCHKQCKSCNAGSGKFSHKARTVSEQYEAGLLVRIGPERLAALKAPHPPVRRRQAEYEALTATYRQKLRDLQRSTPTGEAP